MRIKKETTELDVFSHYEKRKDGRLVAVFIDRHSYEFFHLDRENCRKRLKNLKKQGFPYNETAHALKGWNRPKKIIHKRCTYHLIVAR